MSDTRVTREEFGKLLDAYSSAFARASFAFHSRLDCYDDLAQESLAARDALTKAVFGEQP